MTATIYALVDPRDSAIRYVGSTTSMAQRLQKHHGQQGSDTTWRADWLRELHAAGLKTIVRVLEECDDALRLGREAAWIGKLRQEGATLYNKALSARPDSGGASVPVQDRYSKPPRP